MKIELPDEICQKYIDQISQRMLSDDISKYIQQLVEVELQR